MEFLNFPIVALGAALICLIGVTIYAITQRGSLRSRDEQLVVARAQAYAMLELSPGRRVVPRSRTQAHGRSLVGRAGVVRPHLRRRHRVRAGRSPSWCDVNVRREAVAYLESMWQAEPTAVVDATQNPLAARAFRLAPPRDPLLAPGGRRPRASHHRLDRAHLRAAPGAAHHRSAGAQRGNVRQAAGRRDRHAPGARSWTPCRRCGDRAPLRRRHRRAAAPVIDAADAAAIAGRGHAAPIPPLTGEFELGPLDVTEDSCRRCRTGTPKAAHARPRSRRPKTRCRPAERRQDRRRLRHRRRLAHVAAADAPRRDARDPAAPRRAAPRDHHHFAGCPPRPRRAAAPAQPDPSAIIDPPDPRLSEVLKEIMHVDAARLESFLGRGAREGRPAARHHQTTRARAAGVPRKAGADPRADPRHPCARRAPAAAVGVRARRALRSRARRACATSRPVGQRFPAARGEARRPAEPPRHPGRSGHAPARMARAERRSRPRRHRRHAAFGDRHRHHDPPAAAAQSRRRRDHDFAARRPATQKTARLSDLSQESLEEMAHVPRRHVFQARVAGGRRVSKTCPRDYRRADREDPRPAHSQRDPPRRRNARRSRGAGQAGDRHRRRAVRARRRRRLPAQRAGRRPRSRPRQDPRRGRAPGRAHAPTPPPASIRASSPSLIFRPGFTTVGEGGARGIGMDLVRDLVSKAGGRVGIATKPGEYTRFRITLPHEKKASDAAVAVKVRAQFTQREAELIADVRR